MLIFCVAGDKRKVLEKLTGSTVYPSSRANVAASKALREEPKIKRNGEQAVKHCSLEAD